MLSKSLVRLDAELYNTGTVVSVDGRCIPERVKGGLLAVLFCVTTSLSGCKAQEIGVIPAQLELVGPDVVSTAMGECFPAITADGSTIYFATHEAEWRRFDIVSARRVEAGWSRPVSVPFNTSFEDRAPFLSPDGRVLFYSTNRPLPGTHDRGFGFNIWSVEVPTGDVWADPKPVVAVNTEADDFHASITADGSIYFSSNRPGGYGQYDIYRAGRTANGYAPAENVGSTINSPGEETDVYVDLTERYMIFVATDRTGGLGGDDLWLSVFVDDHWNEPVNLGHPVNSASYEYGPFVSPDGNHLYFTTHRRGLGDIVRIPTDDVPSLAVLASR